MKYRIIKLKRYWHFLWGISELRNGKRKSQKFNSRNCGKLYNYQVELEQSDEK